MTRFGLEYERIHKENQRLVYASISIWSDGALRSAAGL